MLLRGVRCIEIDVYDGDMVDGKLVPIVTHTQFLKVTPCTLRCCLEAISDTAFVTTPYPVVISFENHCSIKGQQVMVDLLSEIFGKAILDEEEFSQKFSNECTLRSCLNRILVIC